MASISWADKLVIGIGHLHGLILIFILCPYKSNLFLTLLRKSGNDEDCDYKRERIHARVSWIICSSSDKVSMYSLAIFKNVRSNSVSWLVIWTRWSGGWLWLMLCIESDQSEMCRSGWSWMYSSGSGLAYLRSWDLSIISWLDLFLSDMLNIIPDEKKKIYKKIIWI